jgi:hypothetical protein
MTSDGIADEDRSRVHDAALEVVSKTDPDDLEATRHLLDVLDELEVRYGRLPGLVATRADYVGDEGEREALYLEAFDLALARSDVKNLSFIAHSLAQLYIEERRDVLFGRQWLAEFRRRWTAHPSEGDEAEDAALTRTLMSLSVTRQA